MIGNCSKLFYINQSFYFYFNVSLAKFLNLFLVSKKNTQINIKINSASYYSYCIYIVIKSSYMIKSRCQKHMSDTATLFCYVRQERITR